MYDPNAKNSPAPQTPSDAPDFAALGREVSARHGAGAAPGSPGEAGAQVDSEPGLVQDVAVFDPALCGTIAQSLAILAEGRAQKALFKTGMAAVGDRDFVLNVLDDCAMSEKELAAVERIGMALGQKYERLARWSPEAGAVLIAGAVGSRYVHAMNVLKAEARKRHKAEGEKKEGA